jgi:hypothetical protein
VSAIRLAHDAFGRLVLTLPSGEVHAGVSPVRAFPFSAPTQWISLCDERGHEVLCLAELAALEPEARATLEAELARRELVPVIRRIHAVVEGGGSSEWHVATDRGDTRFELTSEDSVRRMGDGALIIDAHGIRYRILDARALDSHSRKILRTYM